MIYYVAGVPYSDDLYHSGVKGMKWGVRRYQNYDRTLTPLGKIHYGVGQAGKAIGKVAVATGKAVGKGVKATGKAIATAYKRKHPSLMSIDELRDYTNRINAEIALKEAKRRNTSPLKKLVNNIASKASDKFVNRLTDEIVNRVANKVFGKQDPVSDLNSILNNSNATDKQVADAAKRAANLSVINKFVSSQTNSENASSDKSANSSLGKNEDNNRKNTETNSNERITDKKDDKDTWTNGMDLVKPVFVRERERSESVRKQVADMFDTYRNEVAAKKNAKYVNDFILRLKETGVYSHPVSSHKDRKK